MPPVEGLTARQAAIQEKLRDRTVRGPERAALLREWQTGSAAASRDIRSDKSRELSEKLLGMHDRADSARRALVAELEASLAADQAVADAAAAGAGGGGAA